MTDIPRLEMNRTGGQSELRERITDAIETYNRYRSPMATAELVATAENGFRVRFNGPFCTTCCRTDYFEDLIYELPNHAIGIESVVIDEIRQDGRERFTVKYQLVG